MYNPSKPYKKQILALIESTWQTPYITVRRGVYPLIEKKFKYPEVDHTDGIGTKGYYHWRAGTLRAAVLDALAMNLNDLALVRAVPYKMSNHITVPKEDSRVFKIVRAMTTECRKRQIAMVGGETSVHDITESLDISMTVSGFVTDPQPNAPQVGDVLIGLASSGIHSNGFTKVRQIFGRRLRKEFTMPTAIYLEQILRLSKRQTIHGMMHITGGAFTKLKDILGAADVVIEQPQQLAPQEIFYEMFAKGLSNKTMYTTFNCGIGFVFSVPRQETLKALRQLRHAAIIGEVVKGSGNVHIRSAFDGGLLTL